LLRIAGLSRRGPGCPALVLERYRVWLFGNGRSYAWKLVDMATATIYGIPYNSRLAVWQCYEVSGRRTLMWI
jgi:hypothetical protein